MNETKKRRRRSPLDLIRDDPNLIVHKVTFSFLSCASHTPLLTDKIGETKDDTKGRALSRELEVRRKRSLSRGGSGTPLWMQKRGRYVDKNDFNPRKVSFRCCYDLHPYDHRQRDEKHNPSVTWDEHNSSGGRLVSGRPFKT